jgi:lipoate-protein ligase B
VSGERDPASAGLEVEWLGRVPYAEALALQQEAVAWRRAGACPDRLLLLEHPEVVTLGRRADASNLRVDPAALAARGVEVHRVSRGGDVTWHAPGQLVGYAIVDLDARGCRDVHRFLRLQEAALIDALAELGVVAARRAGMTGVFVAGSASPRKIASIGIGLRGWVSWHGFALNLSLDLAGFEAIVPCGLRGVEMTSVVRELAGAPSDLGARARRAVAEAFARRLDDLAGPGSGLYTAPACPAGSSPSSAARSSDGRSGSTSPPSRRL